MIIEVENLSKKYIIPHSGRGAYFLFREELASRFRQSMERILHPLTGSREEISYEEFWALKDVSFSVEKGEVVGIIGKNGAGKSTLLKILSRITYPTEGTRIVRGRVGSLLQIGTGFHPELTGMENIFLNGAILGMRRREIRAKLDEIIDFSGIEQFLDMPIKKYSTGMQERLAFAVAAHFEPEILLLDEALAVGDVEFQRKCRKKMEEISSQAGKTILVVSHQFPLLQSLCGRCLLLENGRLVADGAPEQIIREYVGVDSPSSTPLPERTDRRGDGSLFISAFFVEDRERGILEEVRTGDECALRFRFVNRSSEPLRNLRFYVHILNQGGQYIASLSNAFSGHTIEAFEGTEGGIRICLPRMPLAPDTYIIDIEAYQGEILADHLGNAGSLVVVSGDYYGSGVLPPAGRALVMIDFGFEIGNAGS